MTKEHQGTLSEKNAPSPSFEDIFLTFRINTQLFALPIAYICHTIMIKSVTPIPLAPKGIMGLTNIHSRVSTVVDMRTLFGVPSLENKPHRTPKDKKTIGITTEYKKELYTLVVDAVKNVELLSINTQHDLLGMIDQPLRSLTYGIHRQQEECIIALDLEKMLNPLMSSGNVPGDAMALP